jgi:hypothetical protein
MDGFVATRKHEDRMRIPILFRLRTQLTPDNQIPHFLFADAILRTHNFTEQRCDELRISLLDQIQELEAEADDLRDAEQQISQVFDFMQQSHCKVWSLEEMTTVFKDLFELLIVYNLPCSHERYQVIQEMATRAVGFMRMLHTWQDNNEELVNDCEEQLGFLFQRF